MQKEDMRKPLDRNNLDKQEEKVEIVKKASEETLKTRKIVQIKKFGQSNGSNTKPTKAVFNLSNATPQSTSGPISGDFTLKPVSSSLSFFKKGLSSGISGEIKINPATASMNFFKGQSSTTTKPKEVKPEPEKKEVEETNGQGNSLFTNSNKLQ